MFFKILLNFFNLIKLFCNIQKNLNFFQLSVSKVVNLSVCLLFRFRYSTPWNDFSLPYVLISWIVAKVSKFTSYLTSFNLLIAKGANIILLDTVSEVTSWTSTIVGEETVLIGRFLKIEKYFLLFIVSIYSSSMFLSPKCCIHT